MMSISSSIPIVRVKELWPGIVGVIVVIVISLTLTSYARNLVSSELELRRQVVVDRARETAVFFEQEVENILNFGDSYVLTLRTKFYETNSLAALEEHLQAIPLDQRLFSHVTIIGRDGRPAFNSKYSIRTDSTAVDRTYFRVFADNPTDRLYISLPHKGRNSDQTVVRLVRPLVDARGRFNGVIFLAVDTGSFVRFFRSLDLGANSSATLVGMDKRIRSRSSYGRLGPGQDISGSVLWKNLEENEIGSYRQTSVVDGVERIYTYRKLERHPLLVAIGLPLDEISLATEDYIFRVYGFAGFAGLLVALGVAFAVRERINKRRLERSSAAKSEFLGHMSHELRTPLNSVIGFADIIAHQVFGKIEPNRYVDCAQDIRFAGRHLLSVIDNILDLVKIEAGKREAVPGDVEPSSCVKECLTILSDATEAKKIDVELDLHQGAERLWVDKTMLCQILLNVLGNAVKFSEPGSAVLVSSRVDGFGRFGYSISDRGTGIDPDDVQKILEPFGQVRDTVTKAVPGTGLGLPISRMLASLNGGKLSIDSRVGEGTTVHVVFSRDRVRPT